MERAAIEGHNLVNCAVQSWDGGLMQPRSGNVTVSLSARNILSLKNIHVQLVGDSVLPIKRVSVDGVTAPDSGLFTSFMMFLM